MISLGKSITSAGDQLRKAEPGHVFRMILEGSNDIASQVEQLRTLLTISPDKYSLMKRKLIYFSCGIFHPSYRKTENFNYIRYFVLDVDHMGEKGLDPEQVKSKIVADSRVMMAFTSPSADGLKIMMKLSEKCFDAARFSLFYKVFAREFSGQHGLDQVIDSRTSDVTRACFLSYDPDAFFREDPEPVNIASFIDFNDQVLISEVEAQIRKEEKEQCSKPHIDEPDQKLPLSGEILQEIKQKLNPRIITKIEKQYFVPEELDGLVSLIEEKIAENNIRIKEVQGIHYGKKIVFTLDPWWAEINIFYGRKGFSAVKTPKRGSNEELADIVYRIICEIIYGTQ